VFKVPAQAYDRYVGRYSPALARELAVRSGVQRGQRALDVGCGPGALTAHLADLLGSERVSAVDPSMSFVEACRARHPGVRVEVASAEALPFEDDTFDRTFAQLVVNFLADAPAGVREMARVTRPTGMVSAATWDYASGMTLIRAFFDAAIALDPTAIDRDEGRHMRYCQPDELAQLWRDCGLREVNVGETIVEAAYEGYDDLWQPLEQGVGPAGAYVVSLPAEARAELRAALRDRLGVGHEPFSLKARAWIVVGAVADDRT
jgi:SAM-dependent methyltransferase